MQRGRASKARSLAHALLVTVVGIVAGLVIPLLVLIALGAAGVTLSTAAQLIVTIVSTQGVAFGGVALLVLGWSRRGRRRPRARAWDGRTTVRVPVRVPDARDLRILITGYFGALTAAMIGAILAYAVGLEPGINRIAELGMAEPQMFLLLIVLSFLLIGPGEELLFRGVVQGRLRQAFGPTAAVVLASAIFAAVHVLAITGTLVNRAVTVAILFLPSLIFGAVYERARNLVVPALVHGAYNATLFWMAYIAARAGVLESAPGSMW